MEKWGDSNRVSACITPEALPGQLQNRLWNSKKWVFHPLDVEDRAGVCRPPSRSGTGWEAHRTQHMLVACVLTAEMGHSTR